MCKVVFNPCKQCRQTVQQFTTIKPTPPTTAFLFKPKRSRHERITPPRKMILLDPHKSGTFRTHHESGTKSVDNFSTYFAHRHTDCCENITLLAVQQQQQQQQPPSHCSRLSTAGGYHADKTHKKHVTLTFDL